MNTKKLALLSLTVAFSLILSFIESQIPPFFPVPGIKLGLANAVVVFLLYTADFKFALAVSLIRIFLASMLFGSVMTLAYSFFGGISSLMVRRQCVRRRCSQPRTDYRRRRSYGDCGHPYLFSRTFGFRHRLRCGCRRACRTCYTEI